MGEKRRLFFKFAVLGFLVMASCSPTTMQAVWKDKDYQSGRLKKILIVGVARNPVLRRMFEDEFAARFKTHGTDAVPSYGIIPSTEELEKDVVESAIKNLGIDAVLVTHLVSRKTEKTYRPATPTYQYRDWYGLYSRNYVYDVSPEYYSEYEVVKLETNIYDTRSEKLIWSGLSDTITGGSKEIEIKSLIEAIMKRLSDSELIN